MTQRDVHAVDFAFSIARLQKTGTQQCKLVDQITNVNGENISVVLNRFVLENKIMSHTQAVNNNSLIFWHNYTVMVLK